MIDRETVYFEVLVFDYVSSIGGYRKEPLAARVFFTEEEAVTFARKTISTKREVEVKVVIKQVCHLINWQ